MKLTCAVALCVAALLTSAFGENVSLPKDGPVVTIPMPNSWKSTTTNETIESSTNDDDIYLFAEVISTDSMEKALKESMDYLEKEKVQPKEDSIKQEEGKVNGIPVVLMRFDGTDKAGPCKIVLALYVLSEKESLSVLYWGSPEGEEKHGEEINSISGGIKLAK